MDDKKTKEESVTLHPSIISSPKKVHVENAPQDENHESTQCLKTESAQHFDIPIICEEATPNVTANLEPLLEPKNVGNSPSSASPAQSHDDALEPLTDRDLADGNATSSPQVRDVKDGANVPSSNDGPHDQLELSKKEPEIDTTAPRASVKHTVSRYGGILDWKAHRALTMERRGFIQLDLEKAHEEIPVLKRLCDAAEEEKIQVQKKLNSTKRLNEELKLNLERAQTEKQQANQDSELASLRMEEVEQGIADEESVAAKAQLEVVRARDDAAVSELKAVQDELQQLQQDFTLLETEKGSAVSKASEEIATSKQVEKGLEDLSIELINIKGSLQSAQAAHLETEEQRTEKINALEEDILKFEKEGREAEEELEKQKHKFSSADNVKAQLATSLALLQKLKGELRSHMDSNSKQENQENKTRGDIQAAVTSAKTELEETHANIKKAIEEVNRLKGTASSLNSQFENEKSKIITISQREGLESQDKLQEATHVANQVKLIAESIGEEYKKAKEEAKQANIEKNKAENRFIAVQKEIEVAKVSEKLALDEINGLPESESADIINEEDSKTKVTLSLEEYYGLSIRAHEAEVDANMKVLTALSEIDEAKESELQILNKLNEVNNDISQIKEELEITLQKVKLAKEGKLNAEEELRRWRTEQQTQKADGVDIGAEILGETSGLTTEEKQATENSIVTHDSATLQHTNPKSSEAQLQENHTATDPEPEEKATKKKKRFFPRFFMFLGRRKSSSKSS